MPQKKRSRRQQPTDFPKGLSSKTFRTAEEQERKPLEIVLKCNSIGSTEAVGAMLSKIRSPGVEVKIIHAGVGAISKSDLVMALTGSKLVLGLEVGVMPKLEQWVKERGVEVRLYNVIYRLAEDVEKIVQSFVREALGEAEDRVIGKGRVIALFKGRHHGIIVGCEVTEGVLGVGRHFRIIAAMGTVYTGRIESLQIEKTVVKEAKLGQQVGIRVSDFKNVRVGDLIECFEVLPPKKSASWRPSGSILHLEH